MMRQRRLITIMIAIIALLGRMDTAHAADSSSSSEYLIKAGFIYNFAKLVEWPANAFPQTDAPIVIGIVGADPFGPVIDKVLEGKKVNGRGFVIRRLRTASEAKGCNILFISSSEAARLPEALRLAKGAPVLTISEIPGFASRGGIINLTVEDDKVRFEVNVEAAKEADLSISSRLLALARIVQPASDRRGE